MKEDSNLPIYLQSPNLVDFPVRVVSVADVFPAIPLSLITDANSVTDGIVWRRIEEQHGLCLSRERNGIY